MEDDFRSKVGIIYLGTRGGGNELTKKLCEAIDNWHNVTFQSLCLSSSNVQIAAFDDIPVKKIEIISGVNIRSLIRVLLLSLRPRKLRELLDLSQGSYVIFPMVSPFDIPLNLSLRLGGVRVIRFLHDAQRHPGDIWPGKITIWLLQRLADTLILLSEYVKSLLPSDSQEKSIVISHPAFDFQNRLETSSPNHYGRYVLFVGRIRRYKGLDQLLDAWASISTKDNLKLLIAGEGRIKQTLPPEVITKNEWLTESTIDFLIRNAELVVFPYQEASQSGLIPFAMSLGKRIVITPVGGLMEQVGNYNGAVTCRAVGSSAIREGIEQALLIDGKSVQTPGIAPNWAEKLRILLNE
jgi:glycosyltransferase involved in cell wall biosynthesis